MPKSDDVWVQLATRVPRTLHRELKLHCVTSEQSVMAFCVEALEEKLAKEQKRQGRRRA